MRKLAPALISYRDDFLISYSVNIFACFSSFRNQHEWIDENYSCATRFSPPADHFHSEKRGHFAFTWYRCEISYWSEILTPVQRPGEFTPVWFAPAWHFVSSETQGQLELGRALLDLKVLLPTSCPWVSEDGHFLVYPVNNSRATRGNQAPVLCNTLPFIVDVKGM